VPPGLQHRPDVAVLHVPKVTDLTGYNAWFALFRKRRLLQLTEAQRAALETLGWLFGFFLVTGLLSTWVWVTPTTWFSVAVAGVLFLIVLRLWHGTRTSARVFNNLVHEPGSGKDDSDDPDKGDG
jgi:Flp pilus assembly protein TadB